MVERCMATCGTAAGARAQMRSRARKEASAQEIRGYYKQFAGAKNLEWQSWADNEVFDLVDLKKFKPKNYVTGQLKSTSRATYKENPWQESSIYLWMISLEQVETK